MTSQKLLVITGNQLTHKYFLNQLGSQFELSAVIIENVQYPDPPFNSDEERKTWDEFFLIRDKTEKSLLHGYDNNISQCYETMDSIEKDLDSLFPNAKTRKQNRKHRADPNGKSTIKDKSYFLASGDAIQISCNDWSKFKH